MNCPNCNKDSTIEFFNECIPCVHCNKINTLSYNVCPDCGFVWKKSEDNKNIIGMVFGDDDIKLILKDTDYVFSEDFFEKKPTMDDVIHRCLRCETVSYEVKEKLYHCPECGFEWEII